jgi:hypothetical protein
MRPIKIFVGAGKTEEIAVTGDYVRVKDSAVEVRVENAEDSTYVVMDEGEDFEFSPFKRLRVSHESGADQSITLIVTKGKKGSSAKVGGSVDIGNLPDTGGAFTQGRASVTNVANPLLAANAARRYLLIQNNDASQNLRVTLDGSAPAVGSGFRLKPGESLEITTYAPTGAINAMMEAASASVGNVEFSEG